MSICEKNECCGCFACMNICPKNAIKLLEDDNGFLYPKIDTFRCIHCERCKDVCNRKFEYVNNVTETCYSAYSKSDKIHINSSSGGIAYEFGKYIISRRIGVVYGVSSYLDKESDISFIRIKEINDLTKIQGSKYVHAYIKNSYKRVLEDLNNNIFVLFIGTPCQVAGLKAYLNKEFEKLITIDIVCHGVMSQKNLKKSIKNTFTYVNFRGKEGFKLIAKDNNKIVYKKNKYESSYFYSFLKGLGYRENCYSCKFANKNRVGDITIGDFWGKKDYKKKNGISLILINTKKGINFLKNAKSYLSINEENIKNAYKDNLQLVEPTQIPIGYKEFIKNSTKNGIDNALHKQMGKKYFLIKIKGLLKKIKDGVS